MKISYKIDLLAENHIFTFSIYTLVRTLSTNYFCLNTIRKESEMKLSRQTVCQGNR